jgi:hypothetical protein
VAPLEVFLKVSPRLNWTKSSLSMPVLPKLVLNRVPLALEAFPVASHLAVVATLARRALLDLAAVLDMVAAQRTALDQARRLPLRSQLHERPSRSTFEVVSMSPRLGGPIWIALVLVPWEDTRSGLSTLRKLLQSHAAEAQLELRS